MSDREAQDIGVGYSLLAPARAPGAVDDAASRPTSCRPTTTSSTRLARTLRLRDARRAPRGARHARSRGDPTSASPRSRRRPARPAALRSAAQRCFGGEPRRHSQQRSRARFGSAEIGDHLAALARRPDGLLGVAHARALARLAVSACSRRSGLAPIPSRPRARCARFSARFARRSLRGALADDAQALRRLVTVFGASAFVGDAVVARPELADVILFGGGAISDPAAARATWRSTRSDGLPDDADGPRRAAGARERAAHRQAAASWSRWR